MTTTTTKCPSWCERHPANEPEAHISAVWRDQDLTVSMETDGLGELTICVGHGVSESLDLTPAQARALATALNDYSNQAEVGAA